MFVAKPKTPLHAVTPTMRKTRSGIGSAGSVGSVGAGAVGAGDHMATPSFGLDASGIGAVDWEGTPRINSLLAHTPQSTAGAASAGVVGGGAGAATPVSSRIAFAAQTPNASVIAANPLVSGSDAAAAAVAALPTSITASSPAVAKALREAHRVWRKRERETRETPRTRRKHEHCIEDTVQHRITSVGPVPSQVEQVLLEHGPDAHNICRVAHCFGVIVHAGGEGVVVWRTHGAVQDTWAVEVKNSIGDLDLIRIVVHDQSASSSAASSPGLVYVNRANEVVYVPDISSQDVQHALQLPLQVGETALVCEITHPVGFVVGTNRSRLLHLQQGRSVFDPLSLRVASRPQGLLSGLTRLFGFGGGGGAGGAGSGGGGGKATQHMRIVTRHTSRNTCEIVVLTDERLEKWDLGVTSDRFDFDFPLQDNLIGPLTETAWQEMQDSAAERPQLQLWLLDIQYTGTDGLLVVLVATVQTNIPENEDPLVTYTYVEVDVHSNPPTFVEGMTLDYGPVLRLGISESQRERMLHGTRMLVPRGQGAHSAHLITYDGLLLTDVPESEEPIDMVLAAAAAGSGLATNFAGWGTEGSRSIIVTAGFEMLSVLRKRASADDGGHSASMMAVDGGAGGGDSDYEIVSASDFDSSRFGTPRAGASYRTPAKMRNPGQFDGNAALTKEEVVAHLASAVEMSASGHQASSLAIVSGLKASSGALVAEGLQQLGLDIVNALPESNPYWAETEAGVAPSVSVLLKSQLEDKMNRHLELLSLAGRADVPFDREFFAQLGERIAAGLALRTYENADGGSRELLLSSMARVVQELGKRAGWSNDDVFYAHVSSIERILVAASAIMAETASKDMILSNALLRKRVEVVVTANEVFQVVLAAAMAHRQNNAAVYGLHPHDDGVGDLERISATSAWMRSRAIVSALDAEIQHSREVLNASLPLDTETQQLVLSQLFVLSDIRLTIELEEMQHDYSDMRFVRLRSSLVDWFAQREPPTHAAELAEKFRDFATLLRLVSTTQSHGGLSVPSVAECMRKYGESGFAEELFSYYLSTGDYAALLDQPEEFHRRLEDFLVPHPDLAWVHLLRTSQPSAAAPILVELSQNKKALGDKKLLLSLAKLSMLASGASRQASSVVRMSNELALANMQEVLLRCQYPDLDATMLAQHEYVSSDQLIAQAMQSDFPDRFLFALTAYDNSVSERTEAQNESLLVMIWKQVISANPWNSLADKKRTEQITDTLILEAIEQSMFYTTACKHCDDLGKPKLSPLVFKKVIHDISDQTVVRLLNTAYGMIGKLAS